jgi:hypothetical protein
MKELESEFFPNDNNRTKYFKILYFESASIGENKALAENINSAIKGIELDEKGEEIDFIKQKVKDILIKLAINNYIVILSPHSSTELVILKRSEGELDGELHCRHCGMEFEDQIQLGNHLRIHYMI